MWKNNVDVQYCYTAPAPMYCYAIISGESGWKRVKATSADGVSNVFTALAAAKANNRKVNVYFDGAEIAAVVLL